jgi:ABC-type nickel/cobalt efflux system permease component RcnA
MDPFALYLTALALGAAHTFEPDHVAAVSAFVVRRPRPREAMAYGVRWAIGHGGVILVAGTVLVALRLRVSADAGAVLERLVGATLIALGLWVFIGARRLHAHRHAHADGTVHVHLHAHERPTSGDGHGHGHSAPAAGSVAPPPTPGHGHRHAATAIGALHGLAGTAPAVALLPMASLDAPGPALAYLAVFGVGTAVAMGLYAMLAGVVAGRAAAHSGALGRGLARCAGIGSVAVGVWWLMGWA